MHKVAIFSIYIMFNLQWTCWLSKGRKWYMKPGCATQLTPIWG